MGATTSSLSAPHCAGCDEEITDVHPSASLLSCEHNKQYHQSCLYQLFDKELHEKVHPHCPQCHQKTSIENIKKMYWSRYFLNAVIFDCNIAVQHAISFGLDITNIRDRRKGDTALHIAAQCGRNEIAKTILSSIDSHETKNDFINTKNNSGFTAAHVAAMYGNTDILNTILKDLTNEERFKTLLNTTLINETTLQIITSRHDIDMLTTVLSYFSGVERFLLLSDHDNDGNTPLHRAAQEGHISCILAILDMLPNAVAKKTLINITNIYDQTALDLAFLQLPKKTAKKIKQLFSKYSIELRPIDLV